MFIYPKPVDETMVGEYPALAKAGAGFFYDDVLEYRVWCYPRDGAEDIFEGDDYYYAFESFESAALYAKKTEGAQKPMALVRQLEWINEKEPGLYLHEKGERIAEWRAEDLEGRKRKKNSIPDFFRKKREDF